jgi:uracil-DNA glycosylase
MSRSSRPPSSRDRPTGALERAIAATARRLRLRVDRPVYRAAGRDPWAPILYAGSLHARVCVFGRDLGRSEVMHGQPLVGPAGRAVRRGVLEALGVAPSPDDPLLEAALAHVLVANTMPYKPPGNRPFPARARERLRPYLEELLVCHFRGDVILTLGNDAFRWFDRYCAPGAAQATWSRAERYGCRVAAVLRARARNQERRVTLCPLPHPSPANVRWAARFPALLRERQLGRDLVQ